VRTVGVKLTADVSSYMANLRRAGVATKEFAGDLNRAASTGKLDHVADRAGVMGIALAGAFGYAVKSAADFDKAMSAVSAATHANAKDMGLLREAALQAGKDTQYSATQAAQGITELSKAGVSTASILGGGLKGALALAAAGQLDVGEAAEIAASAMTQFRLSGDKVPHVADLLAAGAGKAQGSVHDMGMALNQSGLVAAQFGLSIEDTTGVLAEFANAGLIGSDAGTSLKTMLLALSNPSQRTKDEMDKLGISFYDATGKFIGLSGVAQVLQTRLGGLTDAQRQQALGQIFGNDAIRSASILYTDGAKGVAEWKNKVNDAGYASETAAKLTDNLAGDLERLKSSVETLAIESGSGANSGIRVLVKAVGSLVDGFAAMPPVVGSALTILAGVSGAALLGLAAWVKLRKGLAEVVTQLEATGPAGEKAAAGLQKTVSAAGKAALAFAALEAAAAVINSFGPGAVNVDRLTASLTNFAQTGKISGEAADRFGTDLRGIKDDAAVATSGTVQWLDKVEGMTGPLADATRAFTALGARIAGKSDYQSALKNFAGLDTALTNYMSTTNDARKSSELWNQVLSRSGLDTQQLADLLPNAYKKVGELNTAADKSKGALGGMASATGAAAGKTGDLSSALNTGKQAQKQYATEADAAAGAARGERAAMVALSSALRAQTDPVFALLDAEKSLTEAQKNATKAVKEHGRSSDQARDATRKLALAALDLQAKAGALTGTFDGRMTPAMYSTLRAAGLTKNQIRDVAGQFRDAKRDADRYDGTYKANTSAPGAVNAKKQLDVAYTAANKFAGPYQARVSVSGDAAAKSKLAKLLIQQDALKKGIPISAAAAAYRKNASGFARGGWTGPGSKYQEAGVVHADEFVINKESRRKIEAKAPGMLNEMNATGQLPGYDAGGLVTWPFPTTAAMTRIPSKAEVMSAVAGAIGGSFGKWPSSPGAQRGDSGVWRKIVALVNASGIPHHFGNGYRPGDPLWHGSGRAVDWMGYNQDRLAQFFLARQGQVLELIHRSKTRDYGITRGHYHAMPHQWPLHRNHLHVAMKAGGIINEPITGVGASGRTYSFGENYQPERVVPNWQPGAGGGSPAGSVTTINVTVEAPVGSHPREIGRQVVDTIGAYLQSGGELRIQGQKVF
jgi:TP901 family phage tail tape measure protein